MKWLRNTRAERCSVEWRGRSSLNCVRHKRKLIKTCKKEMNFWYWRSCRILLAAPSLGPIKMVTKLDEEPKKLKEKKSDWGDRSKENLEGRRGFPQGPARLGLRAARPKSLIWLPYLRLFFYGEDWLLAARDKFRLLVRLERRDEFDKRCISRPTSRRATPYRKIWLTRIFRIRILGGFRIFFLGTWK